MSRTDARHARLRWLFRRRDETGRSDLPLLSVYRDFGVVPREGRDDNFNKPGENLDAYRVVRRGDLVLNKMKTWQGSLGISDYDGIVSPAYFVAEPLTNDDPTFLHHLLRSEALIGEYAARSKGIRPSQWDLPWEEFQSIAVDLPPVEAQKAIARYLDGETARLDALIAAKRRMVELLEERWQEVLDTVIWSGVQRTTRVMYVVDLRRQVMYGIVLPGPDVGGQGIAIVKGGDVAQKRLSWQALCKTTPEIEAPYARARLRGGDLVFAIRGGIGDVAIVPKDLTGANITQDVARVAPRAGISSEWLMYALQSPTAQRDTRRRVTGATITGLNIWELKRVELPLASMDRQQRDLDQLGRESKHLEQMRGAENRQISLLRERRQALVTAGVTGQLDIPEAA